MKFVQSQQTPHDDWDCTGAHHAPVGADQPEPQSTASGWDTSDPKGQRY